MKKSLRMLELIAVALALFSAIGCGKLRARDQLNKGVQSYKNGKYEDAIDHFQRAVSFDSGLIVARLYLATAYAQQYIPGADTPDNKKMAEQAKKYYHMAADVDPNDPEVYYSIGVIDWTQAYQPRMEERAKLGLKPDEPLKDKKVCASLKSKSWNAIQDGIDNLNRALQLRAEYDDAMAYMNLLYREKADLECDDPAARAADLKTADEWVDKTMAAKKAKAEKQPGAQGITMQPSQ